MGRGDQIYGAHSGCRTRNELVDFGELHGCPNHALRSPVQIARLWAGSNVPGAQCGGGVETDLHAYVRPPGAARDVDIALPIWL